MKKVLALALSMLLAFLLVACGADSSATEENEKKVIGYAQSRMNHSMRVLMIEEFEAQMEARGVTDEWTLVVTDGQNDTNKQTSDVEDLLAQGVDAIVMSPISADPLAPVSKLVMDAGIPLIMVDRKISTEDYTAFVGGDNIMIGTLAARAMGEAADGKEVKVAMIQGTLGASATQDRAKGFMDEIEKYPNITVVSDMSGEYDRGIAMTIMEDILQTDPDLFSVFCQNATMSIGAMQACQAVGNNDVLIFSSDGEEEIYVEIDKGTLAGCIPYPSGSAEAVDLLIDIFAGKEVPKQTHVPVVLITKENLDLVWDGAKS